ncbi:IS4 family transposase [Coraliomargarita sp. SDUM461004]|uniref:IS4 family transposase n=1 Tax=Thalassobacterium sedimentorum TaxID=3041258 RepID=A0ABU1AF33_9BACT|nr:IS4 family transposase [Coraliomargarita sp. SDUM461004]MDQ8193144.1 IS4 family transposase [Coraliomargarita sp. SDUM461004]
MFASSSGGYHLLGRFNEAFRNFIGISDELSDSLLNARDRRGASSKLSCLELLCALSYHCIHGVGNLSSNLKRALELNMSDAGIFKSRQRVSYEAMQKVSEYCLRVRSERAHNPLSFYKDRLLVAIDGTSFNLKNTEDVADHFQKGTSRRSKQAELKEVAFVRINVVCLVELGLHNPLAVEVGCEGESEQALSYKLLDRIPRDCLFLADRLYGNAYFANELVKRFESGNGAFVLRVSESTTCQQVIERHDDGSATIQVPLRSRKRPATLAGHLTVREIRAELTTRQGEVVTLRFWTNLLDAREHPAIELVELYAKRWEHELYFGELKNELKKTALLQSKNVLCAVQEIIIAVWSSALIASVRGAVNRELGSCEGTMLKVSFRKTLDKMRTIWDFVSLVYDQITPELIELSISKAFEELKQETIPKKRKRSCPRSVRQNVINRPKTKFYLSQYGDIKTTIIHI